MKAKGIRIFGKKLRPRHPFKDLSFFGNKSLNARQQSIFLKILENVYTLYQMISVIHTVQTHIGTLLLAVHEPVLGEALHLLPVPGDAEGQGVP